MKKYFFAFLLAPVLMAAQDKPYFQQQVNYKINVKLDDVAHDLNADITMEYINNSPDELSFIWMHLWPNAYKNNKTALAKQLIEDGNLKFIYAAEKERGWIDGLDFKADGQPVKTEPHPEHIDIIKVILGQPLKPGAKITLTTPFHVHFPLGVFSRLGHIGQQYQVTQWYPKPAVYDNRGWHEMPYLNQGEFYSEWGNFDVFITIPKNYVVGATGDYVDGEEELAWLNKKADEAKTIDVFSPDNSFPPSSSEWKTLHLHQENVHDFAWFADKRYYVVKDEVELPHSKRKVTTWGMFTGPEGWLWEKSAKYVADAIYYYSLWNGDYPYNHATAVDGALSAGGGMEYPNITVIGQMGDPRGLDRVIAHEVGHNWFYGILGSNEREYGWMDEGINSFNEGRYMAVKYPPDSLQTSAGVNIAGMRVDIGKIIGIPDLDESTLFDLGYRVNAARKQDQPCQMHSGEYTSTNYGVIVYGKTAILFEYLRAYLGTELFDKCAQAYFDKWKFKHPYPDDIKKVYEEVSGRDLDWFFDAAIKTTKTLDYKIVSAQKTGENNHEVTVKNKGGIAGPFSISKIKNGNVVETSWIEGITGTKTIKETNSLARDFDHLKIDAENKMPDINRQNNTLKMKGLCKKTEPINLRMMGLVHNTDKSQLFWMPVIGWNEYNHFMAGAAIYNNLLPERKLEWHIMPMYAFGNKDLAGSAAIHYSMHFEKIFQTVRVGAYAKRYSYSNNPLDRLNYYKLQPELTLELRKKRMRSPVRQTIYARQVNLTIESAVASTDPSFVTPVYRYDSTYIAINDITYRLENNRKLNPFDVSLNVQQGEDYVKTSVTANYNLNLNKKGKAIDFRFFFGKMIDTTTNGNYYLHSSGMHGPHDYMYDNIFLGRSEYDGFLSHQYADAEGNMKVYTPLGRSNDYVASLGINCPMPGKFPFRLYADIATFGADGKRPTYSGDPNKPQGILYNAGIHVPLIKNIVDVYMPVLVSRDIKQVFYLNNTDLKDPTADKNDPDKWKRMLRMIRFTFNINKLNPFEFVRNLPI